MTRFGLFGWMGVLGRTGLLSLGLGTASLALPVQQAQAQEAPSEAARAEYVRLSREMQRLAERNAWSGVERTFRNILDNGTDPSQQDWIYAAQSAKQTGDVAAMRERLDRANALGENPEVMAWMWEVDSTYGRVELACDPGQHDLSPVSMPFQPDLAAAVRFAQADLAEDGVFNGYLPEGHYSFGPYEIEVLPRVRTVQIDARSSVPVERTQPPREAPERARPERTRPERTRPERNRPARDETADDASAAASPAKDPLHSHLFAVSVGLGNRFGGGVGGGVGATFRVPLGPVGLGVDAGYGYDIGWGVAAYHVGGRFYLPGIGEDNWSGSLYVGGGLSPMVYFQEPDGRLTAYQRPQVTPLGLDVRYERLVFEACFQITHAEGFGANTWFAGYGVGVGIGFP